MWTTFGGQAIWWVWKAGARSQFYRVSEIMYRPTLTSLVVGCKSLEESMRVCRLYDAHVWLPAHILRIWLAECGQVKLAPLLIRTWKQDSPFSTTVHVFLWAMSITTTTPGILLFSPTHYIFPISIYPCFSRATMCSVFSREMLHTELRTIQVPFLEV